MAGFLRSLAASCLLAASAGTASAAAITSTVDVDRFIDFLGFTSWVHDLTAGGYVPGTDITGMTLSVSFTDDSPRDRTEIGAINPEGLGNLWIGTLVDGGSTLQSLSFADGSAAVRATEADGRLTVRVYSLWGDFSVQQSTLTAQVATRVPVPGVLALMGIGLVGLGVAARRRG